MRIFSGNKWNPASFFADDGKWRDGWFYNYNTMKGGHTHNHCSNRELKYIHTKAERKYLRKFLKKKLKETK